MQISINELAISKNSDFIKIKELLSRHTKRAYFVGGFVRDYFLGINSFDIDIEIYDISEQDFKILMNKLGASGVGKSFFVYKYKNFDLSLPRTENKVNYGHCGFEVKICNNEKMAAKRRDFTINSIMINIFNGEILDFYDGTNDLKNKILKVVDKDTFCEDSLRVLRAVQFAARFDLKVENKSLNLMKAISLNDLSSDRIQNELIKLFKAEHQSVGLELIYELNIFEFLFLTKISKSDLEILSKKLENGSKFIKNEIYFLYNLLNFLNLDKEKVLKRLNLNTKFKKIVNEPYVKNPSLKDLLMISLKMPLKNWLGLDSLDLIQKAKKLDIYDNVFKTKIRAQDIINAGFKNEEIGEKLRKKQEDEVDIFLINLTKMA